MVKLSPAKLKETWINYFSSNGHEVIPPHSLIPPEYDKSTLFVNAGLGAIKKLFIESSDKPQMFTSIQKVVRTVDITSIEEDSWHSTYFEMMGNFSIGGYFKREAIGYAVEFLLSLLKIDKNRLVITIYEKDSESESIWKELLGENTPILKLGKANFWEIGEGPCGPCTEIYYDRGEKYDKNNLGVELIKQGINNDRYIEIWNIVFSQFWAKNGEYEELKRKNIDTGAGLERVITIIEEAENIFHSSCFSPLIKEVEKLSGKSYYLASEDSPLKAHFQIISDHIRTLTLIVGEGILPSNKGRGYVVKKLLRRVATSLNILGVSNCLEALSSLLDISVELLSPLHSFLSEQQKNIKEIVMAEYQSFEKVLNNFYKKIFKEIENPENNLEERLFTLVEREGAPFALIEKILVEKEINFSREKFNELYENHKNKSKNAKFSSGFDLTSS
ncbi:alanine--tRNA ligase-related protein [Mycoplasma suis]|uniref:alanine--tRNA ligase n=1 Tax=Mycoplasma suis (strain Illinois) TaxID=768700 RepID=F0QQS6_MYCSL|nr:alanine--tRNA ligase-related protein [Mycoplasma suis]ADX97846.1 alanyl-tRNA synthetase [Mycoplasma suis str. Illinois]